MDSVVIDGAAAERERRWAAARLIMERDNLDGLLVVGGTSVSEPNLRYLSGSPLDGIAAAAFCFAFRASRPLLLARTQDSMELNPGWCDEIQTTSDADWHRALLDWLKGT